MFLFFAAGMNVTTLGAFGEAALLPKLVDAVVAVTFAADEAAVGDVEAEEEEEEEPALLLLNGDS